MKFNIYPENFSMIGKGEDGFDFKVSLDEKEIQKDMEEYDVFDIVHLALALGKDRYTNKYIDGFVASLSLKLLPALKREIKLQGADKKGVDACNTLLNMLKNKEIE